MDKKIKVLGICILILCAMDIAAAINTAQLETRITELETQLDVRSETDATD